MKSPTTVMMIRGQRKELPARSPDDDMEVAFRHRTQTDRLIGRWRAPVLPEETIEVLAELYRMTPKSGMTFVEWLGTKGIGEFS